MGRGAPQQRTVGPTPQAAVADSKTSNAEVFSRVSSQVFLVRGERWRE